MNQEQQQRLVEAEELVERVKPLFKGKDPAIQGAALAELVAIFVAGYPREIRGQILDFHMNAVVALIESVAREPGSGR